jgi:hypothetical protein
MTEPTIDDIRDTLRSALFDVIFTTGMYEIEQRSEEVKAGKIIADNFIRLGLNMKLIGLDEAEDWKAAIDGRLKLPVVSEKWQPEV